MNIDKCIKELVHLHDCVIVPNFGAFIGKYEPAKIHSTELISPPSKTIVFKENINQDDGLLINYISQSEKIEKEAAKKEVENFVQNIKGKLKQGNEICIEDIGCFNMDSSNQLQFKETESVNKLVDSYGFSPIYAKKIKKEEQPAKFIANIDNSQKRKLRPVFIIFSVILALAVLAFFTTDQFTNFTDINIFRSKNTSDNNSFNEKNTKINNALDQLTSKKDALFYQEEPKNTLKDTTPITTADYYLIAASFTIYENALKFKEELKKEGLTSDIVNIDGKHYRISLGAFTDKESALNELERIHTETTRKTVWLLIN